MNPRISDQEFVQRVTRTQQLMRQRNIDILLSYGNEAEPQFLRYYSDYWPSFESGGVLMAQSGGALLLIGPESKTYALDRSRIQDIRRLAAFRESSNPEYPGHKLDTFDGVIGDLLGKERPRKVAIAGYNLVPHYFFAELTQALSRFGEVTIEPADDLVMQLRMFKSPDEIACLRFAGEITNRAMRDVVEQIRPGMTEQQVCGIASARMFEYGAESPAYPAWALAGAGGNQAISRPRPKVIRPKDFVHLQIGARYEGYCATIGRPVFFGEPDRRLLRAVQAGWEGYEAIRAQLFAGNDAGNVAKADYDTMRANGHADWLLYGPCHATGLMEGEPPWIEEGVRYPLVENMCFSICLFMGDQATGHGFRLEDTYLIGRDAPVPVTDFPRTILRK